jgi:hypothetical protein
MVYISCLVNSRWGYCQINHISLKTNNNDWVQYEEKKVTIFSFAAFSFLFFPFLLVPFVSSPFPSQSLVIQYL